MTREQKIEAIYKEMANKKVSFGCIAKYTTKGETSCDVIFIWQIINWEKYFVGKDTLYKDVEWFYENDWKFEIIGHPVMIWDVLSYCSSYISDWDDSVDSQIDLLSYWGDYRLPIEDQPEECIDFVYSQTLKS